jgi:hypothetical protein
MLINARRYQRSFMPNILRGINLVGRRAPDDHQRRDDPEEPSRSGPIRPSLSLM